MNNIVLIGWPLHGVAVRKEKIVGDSILIKMEFKDNASDCTTWTARYLITDDVLNRNGVSMFVAIVDHDTINNKQLLGSIVGW